MLGRRALKLTFVKEPKNPTDETTDYAVDPELITDLAKELVTHTASTVLITYVTVKVVSTICKIAVIGAKVKIR